MVNTQTKGQTVVGLAFSKNWESLQELTVSKGSLLPLLNLLMRHSTDPILGLGADTLLMGLAIVRRSPSLAVL